MFSVDAFLAQNFPQHRIPSPFRAVLRYLLHETEFQAFAADYPHLRGLDFVEQVLLHLNFDYRVSETQLENIPAKGRLILVANHPIGSLDGLVLLRLVGRIRPDVKIVANQLLGAIAPLEPLLLQVDNLGGKTGREAILSMGKHLENEGALIVFPAGEVSRLGPKGVRDRRWHSGFIKLARRTRSSIVPIHLSGRNGAGFYLASWLNRALSGMLLVSELFRQQGHCITVNIGRRISISVLDKFSPYRCARLVREHLYQVGKGKKGWLPTEAPIAMPEERQQLKQAVESCERLGTTPDGQLIYLYRRHETSHSSILRELGRLREIAFRAVGEGTGKRRDLDPFDDDYYHLILWDPTGLEIVGAYRFIPAGEQISRKGLQGLYSHNLFQYDKDMSSVMSQSLELGRSFIQPAYWNRRGLDYLWYGIGAFIARNPQYRYLYGPVSISGGLPTAAKDLLVDFYRSHFAPKEDWVKARHPYPIPERHFTGENYSQELKILKARLDSLGCAIPTLYKQYAELCEAGGVQFMDFGVDTDFGNCIDGLVWVDLDRVKQHKYARYVAAHHPGESAQLVD